MNNPSVGTASTLDQLLAHLPSDPNLRGDAFEKVAKWFLQTDPAYTSELSEVWLWDEWPDRFGADIGIDLVAKTLEGDLWAVQVKGYDPNNQVPIKEIDSFISASSRPEFAHRLLISTGPISRNAEYKLGHQEKSTGFLLYPQLSESPVNWLASLDQALPALPSKKTPRDHQQTAIDDVIDGFASNDKGRLIMACGTGKTLVGVWVAERLGSSRTLVLVPSISLLDQVSREWQTNSKELLRPLFVCSDQTVGDDSFVSNSGELGHPPTTNPEEIRKFLSGPGKRIVFSTYQSSPQISAAQALGAPAFDLVIADEAHHCAGKVDSAFATVLDPEILKADKRLFMTATPRYLTRRVKDAAAQADIQVTSMDDISAFGEELHVLTFRDAIHRNLLSDYRVLILGITDSEIEELTQHRRYVELFGADLQIDAESLAQMVGTIKAIREYDLQHVLTFHNRVSRAKSFVSLLKDLNNILPDEESLSDLWVSHVSGMMTSRERNEVVRQFKIGQGSVNLLSNSRCLGEGVDIPNIDAIGFIDPRRSTIDIAQAVGRAIRKGVNEKTGTIVLPVLINEHTDQSPEEQLEESRFDAIWGVLNALRAHDEVLAEELDSLRYESGRHGRMVGGIPGRINIRVPTSVGIEFVNAIGTSIVETTTASWEFWYGLLEKFTAREGHARPLHSHKEDGFNLGFWMINQRASRSSLTQERVSRLEALPGWVWNSVEFLWEEGFSVLQPFSAREGHARPPHSHKEDGFNLGMWVTHQRVNRNELTPERVSRLEALPGWVWDAFEFLWEEGFSALQLFAAREGHARPPAKQKEDGFNLGVWVSTQRTNRNKLTPERVSRLEALPGWVWDSVEFLWEEGFSALQLFTAREGHARPPQKQKEDGLNLGAWVTTQRTNRNKLTPERVSRLETLPGWVWDSVEFLWKEGFSALQLFSAREGHARPPASHKEDGFNLGGWVTRQRGNRKELTPERVSRLEALPGWVWDGNEFLWEEGFSALQLFSAREGHARPSASHKEDGFNLGGWVSTQRGNRRDLTPERVSRLEALPEWVWDARLGKTPSQQVQGSTQD